MTYKALLHDFALFFAAIVVLAILLAFCGCKTAPRTRVDLPDGTRVETRGDIAKPATIAKAANGTVTITTPTTPPPPAPPTPVQVAQGRQVLIYTIAALGCLLFAGILAWSKHWLAAIFAGCAAAVLHFLSNPASLWIAGICLAVAAALCAAWYLAKQKLSPDTPAVAH